MALIKQYRAVAASSQVARRREMRKACLNRRGVGFLPCRGRIEGRAGEGRGELRRCWKANCLENSVASVLKEGVAEAVRRKVDVGRA